MGVSDTGLKYTRTTGLQPITLSSQKLVLGKGDQTGGPAWGLHRQISAQDNAQGCVRGEG